MGDYLRCGKEIEEKEKTNEQLELALLHIGKAARAFNDPKVLRYLKEQGVSWNCINDLQSGFQEVFYYLEVNK